MVILGTDTYGTMNASGLLSTADEFRFAKEKKKPLVLAKMCKEYKVTCSLPAGDSGAATLIAGAASLFCSAACGTRFCSVGNELAAPSQMCNEYTT
jgi:hypothetical protein